MKAHSEVLSVMGVEGTARNLLHLQRRPSRRIWSIIDEQFFAIAVLDAALQGAGGVPIYPFFIVA
jgi:hypothetical protein